MDHRPVIVVENDPFPRLLRPFLAPQNEPAETAAIAEFLAHDVADYGAWLREARARARGLYPAEVRLTATRAKLHENLARADALVVESLPVGVEELERAPRLRAVHKYGTVLRNIDARACAAQGIPVLAVRRRANIACAKHAYALLLALTRKITTLNGLASMEALRAAGYAPGAFDARYTPNSNWERIGGLRTLCGATAGIIGLGEIKRKSQCAPLHSAWTRSTISARRSRTTRRGHGRRNTARWMRCLRAATWSSSHCLATTRRGICWERGSSRSQSAAPCSP